MIANVCTAAIFALAVLPTSEQRPNFVFVLADDLGWGDLGCYGHNQLQTPNLDRLAREGVLFTQFYVNGSVCSPSRCAFFTGQYPAYHRIHGHYATSDINSRRGMSDFLDPSMPNVASTLKSAGYVTAHIGKWHLGDVGPGREIPRYGFDYVGSTETGGPDGPPDDPYFRARSTSRFVDEALDFIGKHREAPFYLQLWTLVPHATLRPTPEQLQHYSKLRPGGGAHFPHHSAAEIYYATVTDLDQQIGRLVRGIDAMGLGGRTLVLFTSDNGPEDIHVQNAGHSGVGSAGPFRGRKRSLYEGGVRVPGIARWTGRIPKGRIEEESVVAGVDLLPTIAELAGATVAANHRLDGESAADVLLGASRPRRTPLFWQWRFRIFGEPFHHSPELAMRSGDWKLLLNRDRSRVELYDVRRDLIQLNNVASAHPDLVDRMSKQLLEWAAGLPAGPRDPGVGQAVIPWPRTNRMP